MISDLTNALVSWLSTIAAFGQLVPWPIVGGVATGAAVTFGFSAARNFRRARRDLDAAVAAYQRITEQRVPAAPLEDEGWWRRAQRPAQTDYTDMTVVIPEQWVYDRDRGWWVNPREENEG